MKETFLPRDWKETLFLMVVLARKLTFFLLDICLCLSVVLSLQNYKPAFLVCQKEVPAAGSRG